MAKILGITGGIGTGKTYICNLLRDNFDAVIIDADNIAKNITKERNVIDRIVEAFGNDLLTSEKLIDYKMLSNIVFNDKEKLEILNNITHPVVMEQIKEKINYFTNENYKLIVLDVPLPIKEFIDICDYILTVVSNYETRIQRVMKRSNLTKEEVILRINNQLTDEQYKNIADFTIHNDDNTVENLLIALKNIISKL